MPAAWPAIFFGHGNPMNAIASNGYTRCWREIGGRIGKPRAVLMVSAHWYVPTTAVTGGLKPRTVHDFGGFPPELYAVSYPAPGDPALEQEVRKLLAPLPVPSDTAWGLDHGAWSVLCHVFPGADVPVVQLSVDRSKPPQFHYDVGLRLAPLREQGILLAGSGNLVHNLRRYDWSGGANAYDWAQRFDQHARKIMLGGDPAGLIRYESLGADAQQSIPTPDHFLPLLTVLGSRRADDAIHFPVEGFEGGSISMLSVELRPGEKT